MVCANTARMVNAFKRRDLHLLTSPSSQRQSPFKSAALPRNKATGRSFAFTSVLLSEVSEKSLTLIHIFPQIRQAFWCPCVVPFNNLLYY
jgi:hypothetical protein